MTRNSRGPLARSSLSPSFPSTESIDGAVSSSERSASSGRVLHLEVKLFRDSRLVNHHAARQAESLGKLRHGPPRQAGLDQARSLASPGLATPRFLAWRQ